MIVGFEQYPSTKDSGEDWLGDVPAHWDVRRLRNVGKALIGLTYDPGDVVDRGKGLLVLRASNIREGKIIDADNVYVRTQAPERLLTREGDILICSRSGSRALVGKSAMIDARRAGVTFGVFMTVFRSSSNEFLRFVFNSALFERQSGAFLTSTINQLTLTMLYSIRVPFPPSGEQSIIARFLDHLTSRIDRCIRASEKLIELLGEYKQVLIQDAVTGQINVRTGKPYPVYVAHGVDGMGYVPAHWHLQKIKNWLSVNQETLSEDTDPDYAFNYVDIGAVSTGKLETPPERLRFEDSPSRARRVVRTGDTIMSTVRTYLKAVWHVQEEPGIELIVSTGFVVFTPQASTCPRFVSYLCQSEHFTNRVTANSVGVAYPAIAETVLSSFQIAVPPVSEQTAISHYLHDAKSKINKAIERKNREIDLLEEYRTRLIADVVTGKLDVRDAAAELTDSIPSTVRDGNETSLAESIPILRDNSLEKETRP